MTSAPVLAQRGEDSPPDDVIVVTATRSAVPLRDATVPVSVIDRDEIELSQATDLAELLRFEGGLDIARNGGPGQATSLFARGSESNHTQVMIDGVRINPGTIGGAALQHISPELIERVEIVSGGRSALFGTDAIGGVINVITRRASEPRLELGLGSGSFNTRSLYLGGGSNSKNGEFGATVNAQKTDGYAIRTDSDVERGYENLSVNLYGTRRFRNGDVSVRHWQAEGNVEYLDFFLTPVDQDFANRSTAVELNNGIGQRGNLKLIASYIVDDIRQNQSEDFVRSRRLALDGQYSIAMAEHRLAAGIYLADENAASLSFGSGFEADTQINAVFLQDSWTTERQAAFAALRRTDHEAFGGHTTWNLEYRLNFTDRFAASAGAAHAYRAPDASDRFGFGGSIDLKPEISNEFQMGLHYRPGAAHALGLELYRNDISDLIDFDFSDFVLKNTGRAEIRGVQLAYSYTNDGISLQAKLQRQRAEDAMTGARLLRRPEESLTLSYAQSLGDFRYGITLLASGDRMDFATSLPGYVLLNLTGQLNAGEHWQINARIENALDTDYQTAAQFRMQERSVFLDLKYHWK